MKLPAIDTITFDPVGGTHISDAKREAIGLAIEHSCDVLFHHNDRLFTVAFGDLLKCVKQSCSENTKDGKA